MSLKALAAELARHGRFGDKVLVHMAPAEVAGLASLAPGGKLPINPVTGLPEAFFFLPFLGALGAAAAPAAMAATAAGTAAMGGAALAAPALAASALPAVATAAPAAAGALGSGIAAGLQAAGAALPSTAAAAALPAAAEIAAASAIPAAAASVPAGLASLPAAGTAAAVNPLTAVGAASTPLTAAPAAAMPAAVSPISTATPAGLTALEATSPLGGYAGTSGLALPQAAAPINPALGIGPVQTPTMSGAGHTAATTIPQTSDLATGLGPAAKPFPGESFFPPSMQEMLAAPPPVPTVTPPGVPSSPSIPATPASVSSPISPTDGGISTLPDAPMTETPGMEYVADTPGTQTGAFADTAVGTGEKSFMQKLTGGLGGIDPMTMMMMMQGLSGLGGGDDEDDEEGEDLSDDGYYDQGGEDPVFPDSNYKPGFDPEFDYFPNMKAGGLVGYRKGGRVKGYAAGGLASIDPAMQMPQGPMAQGGAPMNMPQGPMGGGLESLTQGPAPVPTSPLPTKQIGSESDNDKELIAQTVAAIKGRHPNPDAVLAQFVQTFGEQALQDLVMRIKGSSMPDGMSDSIPAMIDGQQPAALSQGEFVVPADVVSGLGNGDTGAGAKQLEGMMGRVRTMRGGGAVQPPPINPMQAMPV